MKFYKLNFSATLKRKIVQTNLALIIMLFLPALLFAQKVKINGTVTDQSGKPMIGVSISIKGKTTTIAITDTAGKFSASTLQGTLLSFSHVGYEAQTIEAKPGMLVVMKEASKTVDEVVVVAYGTQKKTSLVSSITSISPQEIKGPTSNLTTMLEGKIAGLVSFQTTGEPGKDNASFFIRGIGTFGAGKVDPLILIDGIESSATDLARLQPDDIAGFSVLKDATATSVYGARGANGVLLITTKTGRVGTMKFNVRIENSTSSNIQNINLADNISYMNLANEAVLTRDPLGQTLYSPDKIYHTSRGDNPLIYPSNNWIQQLIRSTTNNQRGNMNVSGGVEKAKYYLSMSYNLDNGNLKDNSLNGFNNNIKLQSYSILSNVTLNLTSRTEAKVSLKGQFDDYNGPIGGGASIYQSALNSNPVAFPAVYPAVMPGVYDYSYVNHPLFGNAIMPGSATLYNNPYAQMLSGFQTYNSSTMTAQLSLNQNLDFITDGLTARSMVYTSRYGYFAYSRSLNPFYYGSSVIDGKPTIYLINDGSSGSPFIGGTEYLSYNPGDRTLNTTFYGEAAVNYNHTFGGKHAVSGMLIGILQNYLTGNAPDLQTALPSRNEGLSGRFTYGYDTRYLLEFDFGYNGSERFAANHRYGFFPSVGGAWIISNEKFFKPLSTFIENLKLRFTYGLIGNDQIGSATDRFFYLSNVNLNGPSAGNFGTNYTYSRPTVSTSRYANPDITWEQSQQLNLGMDLTFLNDFKLGVDAYHQKRTNILMTRTTIPTTMGLQVAPSANVGQAASQGVDIALDYHKTFNTNWWLTGRGTFTYATSKILVNEEPKYAANDANLSKVGQSINAIYGLVAERLFTDQIEVNNSPSQFGNVLGGDIKYRDINGDGKITAADYVPMGYPSTPEIQYGYGFSLGYKHFDISVFFQGTARVSFMIDPVAISPFYNQHGLLSAIANDHWSEDNRNSYAFWPRLNINSGSDYNDNQPSSWWLRDGSFMRLKSAEIGYNFSSLSLKKLHLASARIYLNGTNLLTFSSFKLWDPEMGASGLGYPIQRVINIGFQMNF